MKTLRHWLDEAARDLQAAGVDNARLDARLLLMHVLAQDLTCIVAHDDRALSRDDARAFRALVDRRRAREPLAQILGRRSFWKHEFRVTADVLDPRPDTEILVERAVEFLRPRGPARMVDFGVGSGAILLSLLGECPDAWGVGVDRSARALAVARDNARALGLETRAQFMRGDWGQALTGAFDLIVSNPPYIPSSDIADLMPEVRDYEPRLALDGGPDGFDAYRLLLADTARLLAHDGRAFFEMGAGQDRSLAALASGHGLAVTDFHADLSGIPRVAVVQKIAKRA